MMIYFYRVTKEHYIDSMDDLIFDTLAPLGQ